MDGHFIPSLFGTKFLSENISAEICGRDWCFLTFLLVEISFPGPGVYRKIRDQTNFEYKSLPNKFQKKPLPKNAWRNMRTQNNVKRNLCKKNSEESLPKKSNTFSIIFFRQKTLPRKLWRDILCSKIWREISTKKSFKRQFPAKKSEEKPLWKIVLKRNIFPKMKKHLQQQNCKQSWQET